MHLLDEARVAFRPHRITAECSRDQIMIDEGASRVLTWLEARIKQDVTATEISNPTVQPNSFEAAIRAAFGSSSGSYQA